MKRSDWFFLLKQTGSVCVLSLAKLSISHFQVSPNLFKMLNVCHSTFGICFQEDLNIGGGNISLLILVPAHSRPAISFVFFYDVQELALCHGNGAFVVTLERRRKGIFIQNILKKK